ncbi:MAG TPA: DUF4328 domain-containing protein [Myxococcaceae bacterium]|nr:DUF4328 domain-containing protein [Myxococcaceae bacterium]
MTSVPAMAPREQAVCPTHPAKAAVGTCERCGRYVCAQCQGTEQLCPDCIRQRLESLPSSEARAKSALGFFKLTVFVDACALLINLWVVGAPEENTVRLSLEGVHGLVALVALVGTIVTFLRWQHLVVRHVNALGINVDATPGWAVGWWFIPFANLVKPYRIMRATVSGLGGDSLVDSLSLGWWWAAWVIGNMLENAEGRMVMRSGLDNPTPTAAYAVGIGSAVFSIAGALLCMRIIRGVQEQLEARRPSGS